jgi:hypothetical protein
MTFHDEFGIGLTEPGLQGNAGGGRRDRTGRWGRRAVPPFDPHHHRSV